MLRMTINLSYRSDLSKELRRYGIAMNEKSPIEMKISPSRHQVEFTLTFKKQYIHR